MFLHVGGFNNKAGDVGGFGVGQLVEQRQAYQAVAIAVAVDQRLALELVLVVHAGVQGQVVEGGLHAMLLQPGHEARAEVDEGHTR